jgi:hypothetical protein
MVKGASSTTKQFVSILDDVHLDVPVDYTTVDWRRISKLDDFYDGNLEIHVNSHGDDEANKGGTSDQYATLFGSLRRMPRYILGKLSFLLIRFILSNMSSLSNIENDAPLVFNINAGFLVLPLNVSQKVFINIPTSFLSCPIPPFNQ